MSAGTRPRRLFDRALVAVAERLVEVAPLEPIPGWTFGDAPRTWRASARKAVWKAGALMGVRRPVVMRWHNGMVVEQHLGNDLSRCLYVGGAFEPNELAFLAATLRAGDVFVDVGANEGLYTVVAASVVGPTGRVVAVEPSSRERARLQANLARSELHNVVTLSCALDEERGSASLQVADARHAGHNTLGRFAYDGVGVATVERVTTMTLDHLVSELGLTRVDLVKIDVEGSEARVLKGASDTLEHHRPTLLLELQDASLQALGSSTAEVLDTLAQHRYQTLSFSELDGRPAIDARKSHIGLNIVAVPKERA